MQCPEDAFDFFAYERTFISDQNIFRFKSDDHYLKELIAEWCEGVLQNNNQQQEEATAPCNRTDIGKPRCLILEKVAEHLQKSFTESLAIDLQELTKVRIIA